MSDPRHDVYLDAFEIKYGDRPDYYFLLGVLGQVISEHDPESKLPVPDLLDMFYERLESLGLAVLD